MKERVAKAKNAPIGPAKDKEIGEAALLLWELLLLGVLSLAGDGVGDEVAGGVC